MRALPRSRPRGGAAADRRRTVGPHASRPRRPGGASAASSSSARRPSSKSPPSTRSLAGKSFGGDLPRPTALRRTRWSRREPCRPAATSISASPSTSARHRWPRRSSRSSDGSVAASASSLNPQVAFGADVISRIRHTIEVRDGLAHLQAAVRAGLASADRRPDGRGRLRRRPGRPRGRRGEPDDDAGVAGGAGGQPGPRAVRGGVVRRPDAESGRRRPADRAERQRPRLPARSQPRGRRPRSPRRLRAASIAREISRGGVPRLLIDLGTNTELLLECDGRLVTTSAAAGPAFEGVAIRQGMRGAPGAIDVVSISADGRVRAHTIGSLPARGLCGSGLIDAVAELLRAGVVSASGYLRKPAEVGLSRPGRTALFARRPAGVRPGGRRTGRPAPAR